MTQSMKEAYKKWEKTFKLSRLGKNALTVLKRELELFSPDLYTKLEREVLASCFHASWHKQHHDKFFKLKQKKRSLKSKLPKYIISLNEVLKRIKSDSSIMHDIYLNGHTNLEEKGIAAPAFKDLAYGLEALIAGMEIQNKYEPEGLINYGQSYRTGNMAFYPWVADNKRIDAKHHHKRIEAETFLAFELSIYFRLWTNPDGQSLFNSNGRFQIKRSGIPAPDYGRPRFDIVWQFVQATINPPNLNQQKLSERIKKYKTAYLVEWKWENTNTNHFLPL